MTFSRRQVGRLNRGRIAIYLGVGVASAPVPTSASEGSDLTVVSDAAFTLFDVSTSPETSVGSCSVAPFEVAYTSLKPGTRRLQIQRTSDHARSSIAVVTVSPQAPSLDAPTDAAAYNAGDTVAFTASGSASGFDANTNSIAFLVNGVTRATDSSSSGGWTGTWDTTGASSSDGGAVVARRTWHGLAPADTGTVDSTATVTITISSGFNDATSKVLIDSFAADGTWTRPTLGAFWGISGSPPNTNRAMVRLWAAGGGGTTATGAGGGGAFSEGTDVDVSGSSTFAIAGLTAGAANASAADATFGSTLVVADGGLSGTAGGKGGLTANGTGDVKFAGGDGGVGAGNTTGGSCGGSTGSASGATPGEPDGGHGQSATAGFAPGAGGGSAAAAQQAGARGHAVVVYQVTATPGYARLRGYSKWRATANATSHSVTMPATIVAGEKLVAIVNGSNTSALSASGWSALTQQDGLALLYKTAAGSDALTVAQGTSGRIQVAVLRFASAGAPEWTTTAAAVGANGDPPSHTSSGGSVKGVWIAIHGSTGRPIMTAIPSGYGTWIWEPPVSATGTLGIAMKDVEASSENPGAFTINSSTQTVATALIPPA